MSAIYEEVRITFPTSAIFHAHPPLQRVLDSLASKNEDEDLEILLAQ